MNLSKGLQRVSAAWWGVVALGFGLLMFDGGRSPQYIPIAVFAMVAYGLHWVTCWIVKGFFGDGK